MVEGQVDDLGVVTIGEQDNTLLYTLKLSHFVCTEVIVQQKCTVQQKAWTIFTKLCYHLPLIEIMKQQDFSNSYVKLYKIQTWTFFFLKKSFGHPIRIKWLDIFYFKKYILQK